MSNIALRLIIFVSLASALRAASPTEQKVLELFESKCAKCHTGDNDPELNAKTDLSTLRKDDTQISAGDPDNSKLYKLVNLPADDKNRMPKSKSNKPLPPLTDEEKQIIATWIKGEGTARAFLSEDYVGRAILDDLKSVPSAKATNFRYLTLANIYNEREPGGNSAFSDEEMEHCRTGVTKLMNSISMKTQIIPVVPVDANKIVLRINLPDYDFSPALWARVASAYPYLVRRNLPAIAEAERTLNVWPVMRADYFVFVFAQPPMYHEALGIPGGTGGRGADIALEAKLGLSYESAIKAPEAVRAGFQHSQVSMGNRLIERLPRPEGHYYWKSYDFDPNRQNERGADVFRSPLGPANAGLTAHSDLKFAQDGGEIVFSLPNHLQGYMLINASGKRLDEGPVNVVTDRSPESRGGRIINGISCIRCHAEGLYMAGVHDEMLAATKNLDLDGTDRATIERLHNQAKLETHLKADAARYAQAVAQCGPSGKPETINLLYHHFSKSLNAGQIAGELGYDKGELADELASAKDPEVKTIGTKFQSHTPVPRIDFEKAFPTIIASLSLGSVSAHDRIQFTEFGGNLDLQATQKNEGGGGVTVRAPIKNRDVRSIDAAEPDKDDASPNDLGIKVTRHAPGSRGVEAITEAPRKVIRINPDGTIDRAPGTPPADASDAGKTTTNEGKPGRKVIKIDTPKPGEDDFNTQQVPAPKVKPNP